MSSPKKVLYIVLGTVFLVLGTIGIFVPLLPTTPFWLLTSWLYLRSSKRLYDKAMANKYFGLYVRSYMEDKAIPLRAKIVSVGIMWTSMILTSIFLIELWWVKLILLCIAIGVSWHILSFPTKKVSKES